jgi:hypothetical protein
MLIESEVEALLAEICSGEFNSEADSTPRKIRVFN